MKVESGGRTHMNGKPIVSRAGAMGLMQVMPSTYEELRVRHGLGSTRSSRTTTSWLARPISVKCMRNSAHPVSRRLQCRSRPLRRISDRRPWASQRNTQLRRDDLATDHGGGPNRRVADTMYAAIPVRSVPDRTVVASTIAPPRTRPVVTASALPVVPVQAAPLPAARPTAASPVTASAPAGDWGIQVGAFRSPTESNKAVEEARRAVPIF